MFYFLLIHSSFIITLYVVILAILFSTQPLTLSASAQVMVLLLSSLLPLLLPPTRSCRSRV